MTQPCPRRWPTCGSPAASGWSKWPVGRRPLARLLIDRGYAHSLHGAFTGWLARPELADVPQRRLPAADAIALVRGAGGVTSWAHPPADADLRTLEELRSMGLGAVEC